MEFLGKKQINSIYCSSNSLCIFNTGTSMTKLILRDDIKIYKEKEENEIFDSSEIFGTT